MTEILNEVILASAGTGKTHALTNRLLRLLALGANPESILALTFTRKAAGEFSTIVFRRLAQAAANDEAARQLAKDLQLPSANAEYFLKLLTRLINAMDQLQFCTFDAFFQRVVSAMPFDFGLPGNVQILDPVEATNLRGQVLSHLLDAEADTAAQEALLAAYREATWGVEEKGFRRKLEQFIESSYARYLECHEARRWGNPQNIWPNSCGWLESKLDLEDAYKLERWAQSQDGEVFRSLEELGIVAQKWKPGMRLPTGRVFEQLLEQLAANPEAKTLVLTYRRKEILLDPEIVLVIRRVINGWIGESLRRHLRVTAGIHQVLEPFDVAYHNEVRLSGRLAFEDVVEMLHRIPAFEWQARLDAKIDHWLFDEFQDTSHQQWMVVSNLVDEVLQDNSGRRSLFLVGDPKQSIYRWRGGEHRLLELILARYRSHITERSLVKSYRSDPEIIELVNRYGELAASPNCGLPIEVVKEWAQFWETHESVATGRQGHVTIRALENPHELADRVLAELERIKPIDRGLSCAVLTRDNQLAQELAAELRERGFLCVTAETDEQVAMDAPINRCLLALISAVSHPGDSASRVLVEMSPLRVLIKNGWPEFRAWFFAQVTKDGLEVALISILNKIAEHEPIDAFSQQRLQLLLRLARKYDAISGGLDDFLQFATTYARRRIASLANVQILTIHRAKGLGFDVVLLPMLDTTRMDAVPRETFLTSRGKSLTTQWLLHQPTTAIAKMDPVLREAHHQQVCHAAYDELCVWYVGLTRAKHALHVFTVATSKLSDASPAAFIQRCVGEAKLRSDGMLWETGDSEWFAK